MMHRAIQFIKELAMPKFTFNKTDLGGYTVKDGVNVLGRVERGTRDTWVAYLDSNAHAGFGSRNLAAQFLADAFTGAPVEDEDDTSNDNKVYRALKDAGTEMNADQIAKVTGVDILAVKVILMRFQQQGRIIRPRAARYAIK